MELLEAIITLFAGIGVFMVGMKMMSDGLEHGAGGGLKKLFGKISGNRFAGVGVGAAVTAIIQSSSATTVMVIGFVNAGIMTLFQAASIIMGANIGTTVTGVLIAFSSFDIGLFATALAFIGVIITLFAKKDLTKTIGGIFAGLGLIFVGLSLMSNSLKQCEDIRNAFSHLFATIRFPLVLILLGTVFTALIQSSSATTGIIIALSAQGVLPVASALFIVIGTNIGTCVTALIASVGATRNAKRTAIIHLIFNLFGSLVFTALIWPLSDYVVKLLQIVAPNAIGMQIAWFHIIFNITTTLLLLPFITHLTKLATFIIKDKNDEERQLKLYYLDDRILQTPPIAVTQTLKEVANMAELAHTNLIESFNSFIVCSIDKKDKILRTEEKINYINKGVAKYLIKLSSQRVSVADEQIIGSLYHVIGDIERIGDHAKNFIERTENIKQNGVKFSDEAVADLTLMYEKVESMFKDVLYVFNERDTDKLEAVSETELQVDGLKKEFGERHIERLKNGDCSAESGIYFYATITELERVADHLVNIAFSIKSPSGSQIDAMNAIAKEKSKRNSVFKSDG